MHRQTPMICVSLLMLVLPASSASAQEQRYAFETRGETLVRIDRQTGKVSTCRDEDGDIVCRMVADDRIAYEAEIADLQKRLDALEQRLSRLENGSGAPAMSNELPTDEEFERTMGFMEKFFRRFMGIIQDMEGKEAAPFPDRT